MKNLTNVPISLLVAYLLTVMALASLADEWEATLTATSNDNSVVAKKLFYKTVLGATDGFDAGKDTPAPPQAPAPIKLDAFFPVAGNLFISRLRIDARPPAPSISWQFTLQADEIDGNLSWDIGQIPSDYTVMLMTNTTTVNMRTTTSTPYMIGKDIYTITVKKTKIVSNDAPLAESQSAVTNEDEAIPIMLIGTDQNQDDLTYQIVETPAHGTLTGTAPNFTYTPVADYNGEDRFTFQVSDEVTSSQPAAVTITINPVNDTPIAVPLSLAADEDAALSLSLEGTDADGDSLIYEVVEQPSHGTLTGTEPDLTYTPVPGYNGEDKFTFLVGDGVATSRPEMVIVIVQAINQIPVAMAQSVITDEDITTTITLEGLDDDSDELIYEIIEQPSHGTLSGTAPNFTYTPVADYNGEDIFTFQVSDEVTSSQPEAVKITINAINDTPVAIAESIETAEDNPIEIVLVGNDIDGDDLTYRLVETAGNGQLSTIDGQKIIYTPDANYYGVDQFVFVASDDKLSSPSTTIQILVTPVNDPPVALSQQDQKQVKFDTGTAAISLQGQDVEGDQLSYLIVDQPSHGQLSGIGPNLTYTPNASFTETDQFTFKVNDGNTDSEIATVDLIRPLLPFKLEFSTGLSLIHLPLKVRLINGHPAEIQTIGDLFDALGINNVSLLITYSKLDKAWVSYWGAPCRGGQSDRVITPALGIIAYMKQKVVFDLQGEPWLTQDTAEIQLNKGLNLIGLPVKDPRIKKA
ncbi:MAG: Ig-like domain-containing protein, partial [Candidatus Poribacteria bacterium]|nr:Ig-like domain-containing protein [Candidatus Poribacteria bacterium]